jgi:translation initiation factor 1
MAKKIKNIIGDVVFSTNPDFVYETENNEIVGTLSNGEQNLRVWLDRKMRKGKVATLIQGFVGSDDDLKDLAKLLKTKCSVGGAAKDGEIVLQGDVRDKVMEILQKEGYRAKKAGGR